MVETAAFHVLCIDADRRDAKVAYTVIDPAVLKCLIVDLPTACLIDASYSVASYYYPWLYPFYITRITRTTT